MFTAFEARRDQDQLATTATLAENPTLKAAFDTYTTEARLASNDERRLEAQQTVTRELEKLAAVTSASVLAILDAESRVFASAGTSRQRWPANETREALESSVGHDVSDRRRHRRRRVPRLRRPLRLDDRDVGTLVLGTSLDDAYAEVLADLSRAGIVITVNHEVDRRARCPKRSRAISSPAKASRARRAQLNGEEYAIRTLLRIGSGADLFADLD